MTKINELLERVAGLPIMRESERSTVSLYDGKVLISGIDRDALVSVVKEQAREILELKFKLNESEYNRTANLHRLIQARKEIATLRNALEHIRDDRQYSDDSTEGYAYYHEEIARKALSHE